MYTPIYFFQRFGAGWEGKVVMSCGNFVGILFLLVVSMLVVVRLSVFPYLTHFVFRCAIYIYMMIYTTSFQLCYPTLW
ncbi:hypothetical protein DFP73DRAFT_569861 [Morchella snyderi]|nr:hypothetical protein DFP73DRAFT_569861 [Morchella snyderi]